MIDFSLLFFTVTPILAISYMAVTHGEGDAG